MRTSLKWIKDLVPGIEDLTPQELCRIRQESREYCYRTDFKNRKAS